MMIRTLGRLCLAGGVIGVIGGLVTAFVPAAVGTDRFSYPYTPGWYLTAETAYLLNHVLMLAGAVGVIRSGVAGTGRLARSGGTLAVSGLVALGLCEVAAMFLLHASASSPAAGWLGAGYGVASLLTGTGLVLLGVAVARTAVWTGWRRWIVLTCGAALFLVVLPAISGPFLAGRLGLVAWLTLFIALGIALARPAVAVPSQPARVAAALD
jgi:hypothetical protein